MNISKPEVVVITGASAGIGRATAHAFAKEGAHIGLVARSRDALEAARQEVEEMGGKGLVIPADVSDSDQVEKAAATVEETFGPIDVWVNNAMASILSPFMEIKLEDFKRCTEVTYLGYVYGTMSALRRMKPRDKGTIVQVGSGLAHRSIPLQSAYCGAKAAIRGFTDSLRSELFHDNSNVHITMVQLPAVNTPQFDWIENNMPKKPQPVPPIFQPEVAADAIVWSAHHKRRELYVGGSTVKAIMANKVAPGLLDCYLAQSGYTSQQTDEPEKPQRDSNLWQPGGDRGTHGRFDDRAQDSSIQLEATKHQNLLALAAGAGMAALAVGTYLGYSAQPKQSNGRRQEEDKMSESNIGSGVVRKLQQEFQKGNKIDQFHLMMGLARWGWKALSGNSQKRSEEQQPLPNASR
ncbi:MAG: SDR family oxidoreductase [Chroococcales cyanobacterium]